GNGPGISLASVPLQVGGFGTPKDLTGIGATPSIPRRDAGSIAHQAAYLGIFSSIIDGGNSIARREHHQLIARLHEERVGANDESVGSFLGQHCKDGIKLTFACSLNNFDG